MLVGLAALSLTACGKVVQPGNAGIMIKTYGGGVQTDTLSNGFHFTGPGSYIVEFPTITRTYQWTAGEDGDNKSVNEEFAFNDSTGLPLSADLSITMRVDPAKVSSIYTTYRLGFNELLHGPIRSYVRTAIAMEASAYTSDQLYTNARQQVVVKALADVQKHFAAQGIEVEDLQWIGSIRFPASVSEAIENKTKADQEAQVAERQVQVKKAEADAAIAEARGEAESTRIRGEAIRSNPQVLQEMWIKQWDGKLPTYVGSGKEVMMVNPQ